MTIKLIVFVLVSAGILLFSLPSLRNPKSHGFFRFFAFEIILVLFLANFKYWVDDPLSVHQILSWVLLICSLLLAVHGFRLLQIIGRPRGNFENTTQLVIVGAYKYIRHPLYCSLLLLTWGICLKDPGLFSILLGLVASVFLYATARAEESENQARFGAEYEAYLKSTKMFIPGVF